MKREWTLIVTVLLLLTFVMAPMTAFTGSADTVSTTTLPSYTTTTTAICNSTTPPYTTTSTVVLTGPDGTAPTTYPPTTETSYDCVSDTTWPPTTTTTIALTGPDGTVPTTYPPTTETSYDCVSDTTWPPTTTTTIVLTGPDGTAPTTYPPTTDTTTHGICGNTVDLLSTAEIVTGDNVSILGNPTGGNWLCCDCYSYDGEYIMITPTNGCGWNLATLPYLHLTVCNNMVFSIEFNAAEESMTWFPNAIGSDNTTIAEGSYVVSLDLAACYLDAFGEAPAFINITEIIIHLSEPGSISLGHLALSSEATCHETAPRIQTTTKPSFPWDTTGTIDTTTSGTTTPTTAPITTAPTETTAPTVATTTPSVIVTTTTPPSDTTTNTPPTTTGPTTNPTVGDALLPGDVDSDESITTRDARLILLHIIDASGFNEDQQILADFNGDGNISTVDARLILIMLIQ